MADDFQPRFVDLVRSYTSTVGTADFNLGSAPNGYIGFADACAAGDQFYYSAIGIDKPAEYEIGRGVLQANGVISRDPISGTKTNFTTGIKSVALIAAAEWFGATQAAAESAPSAAASRSALSSCTHRRPTFLSEAGREGVFVWDGSNLTAQVSADPAQGLYVAPTDDPTGTSGAWVRKFAGPADFRWFGAVADCTAAGTGTSNTEAFDAARSALIAAGYGWLHIPQQPAAYRFATAPAPIHDGIKITGDGWHENPGKVGTTSYYGVQSLRGTVLCFDPDTAGFQFIAASDNNADSFAFEYQSSVGSIVRDLVLYTPYGGGATGTGAHGIETRTVLNLDNVRIEGFAGYGLKIIANSAGAVPYGGSDSGSYRRVSCRFNKLSGIFVSGDDANVNHFDTCDSAVNGGAGFLIPAGLGNKFTNCHAASNNQSHPANDYAVFHSAAQRAQNESDWAGLADQYAGSFVALGQAAANLFDDCYTEIGQGQKARIVGPSIVHGGNLASSASHTDDSTGVRYNSSQIINLGEIHANDTGVLSIAGHLNSSTSDGTAKFLRSFGSGAYSILQMYGVAGIAFGLDIITGQGVSGFSSDQFIFRNAAQNLTFSTTDSTGFTINSGALKIGAITVCGSDGVLRAAALPALTGDVTTVAGSLATTIANGAVTYAKMQSVAASRLLGNPTAAGAAAAEIGLGGGLAFSGSTLTVGALTPASVAASGGITSSGGGIGYAAGAGGAVTQTTSKSTGVTINKLCGQIISSAETLAANSSVSFTVTNDLIAATDTIDLVLASGNAGPGTYNYQVDKVGAGSFDIWMRNVSDSSLSEELVFNFSINKSVAA